MERGWSKVTSILILLTSTLVISLVVTGFPPLSRKAGNLLPSSPKEASTIFGDAFSDSSINPTWTVVVKGGSIMETASGNLEFTYPSKSTPGDWWGGVSCTAPHAYVNIPSVDFNITTRNANTAGMPDYAHVGILLYLDLNNVVFFGSLHDPNLGNGIALEYISGDTGYRDSKAGNYLDQYLRVRRINTTYYFEYSANNVDWSLLKSCQSTLWNFNPSKIGLFMKEWEAYRTYTAMFDYFYLTNNSTSPDPVPEPDRFRSFFSDDFSDSSINPTWAVVVKGGSITETASGYLEISYPSNSTPCDWWGGETCTAPHAYIDLPNGDFNITTRNMNTAGMPDFAHAGILLYLDLNNVVFFGSMRDLNLGNGMSLEYIKGGTGVRDLKAGNYLDQYLRVRKEGTTYYFEYSADGATWTLLKNCTEALWNFSPAKVGLFMKVWEPYHTYTAQFDYFTVTSTPCIGLGCDPSLFPWEMILLIGIVAAGIVAVALAIALKTRSRAPRRGPGAITVHEKPLPPSPVTPPRDQGFPTLFPRTCPTCGTTNQEDALFCMDCGASLPRESLS